MFVEVHFHPQFRLSVRVLVRLSYLQPGANLKLECGTNDDPTESHSKKNHCSHCLDSRNRHSGDLRHMDVPGRPNFVFWLPAGRKLPWKLHLHFCGIDQLYGAVESNILWIS